MSFIFFLMLCFLLPIGTSLRFLTPWSIVDGQILDVTTFFIYVTDLLVVLVLVFWLIDILVKFWRYQDWDDWQIGVWPGVALVLFWILALLASYSIFWSYNGSMAFYHVLRLWAIFFLLAYILLAIGASGEKWQSIGKFVVGSVLIQSVWGIVQYWRQADLGLWWLGESHLGKDVLGVAKVDVAGEKIVRAYGSLGHANVYSFLMLLGLILILGGIIYFGRDTQQRARTNEYMWGIILGIISIGCLVGYSRSVWVAGVVVMIGFVVEYYGRGTLQRARTDAIIDIKFWIVFLLIMVTGIISNWSVVWTRLISGESLGGDVSFNVRVFLSQAADWIIDKVYYVGVGIGNFVMVLPLYSSDLSWWMYQPVHNVFKLIWAELGVIGFGLYVLLILTVGLSIIFSQVKNYPKYFWLSVFLAVVWLHFFDHYLWDVWAGQLIFVFLLGMILSLSQNSKVKSQI